jgi:hypothetical protein
VKKIIVTILSLLVCIAAFAQTRKVDSTLVTFYPTSFDSISLKTPYYLDTTTFHANNFDPLENNYTLYSTLSNIGMPHKALRFNTMWQTGFDMSIPSFLRYIKTEKDLKTYLSLLPYSEIRYVMTTGDKEQHLNFKFGRQLLQGLFLSFEYNINYSPGVYANNKSDNNYFWINALYTTKDQRYNAMAYWFRNKIEVQENGGIVYDEIYVNQQESDNSVILTNLNNSTNYAKISGIGFQHYFNLLPQHKKTTVTQTDTVTMDTLAPTLPVTDSVTKRKFTLGRINHSFAYQRNQLFYNETSADLPFYAPFDTIFSIKTTDTTIVQSIRNSLTWNTLGYQNYSDNIPFYLYAGIDYDFFKIKHYDYLEGTTVNDQNHSQVSIHGGIIINLFKSTTISGDARLITLGYQIGDFNIKGKWRQYLGTTDRNFGKLVVDFNMKRQSPTWFESQYQSNHFRWNNDFHAATYLCLDAHYHYKFFYVGIKNTSVNDLIYFNQEAKPTQHDGFASISEIYGNVNFEWWRFRIEGFLAMQKSSNEEIIRLPLLLGKMKIGYSQPIFKKAATLQPSLTVQYFTKYRADAYMPALRTFYLQDDVLIGNFPFIDLALAINVKQADIYVQYSNMFLLTGNHNSFIAPHYPMRDSKIFIGVNWRLFN